MFECSNQKYQDSDSAVDYLFLSDVRFLVHLMDAVTCDVVNGVGSDFDGENDFDVHFCGTLRNSPDDDGGFWNGFWTEVSLVNAFFDYGVLESASEYEIGCAHVSAVTASFHDNAAENEG